MSWKCAAKRIINWANRKFYGMVCLQDNADEDENDFPAFFDETMKELKVDYDFAGFERDLVTVKEMLDEDVEAAYNGDPAAKSKEEIITAYPGFYATLVHRIARLVETLENGEVERRKRHEEHGESRDGGAVGVHGDERSGYVGAPHGGLEGFDPQCLLQVPEELVVDIGGSECEALVGYR